MQNEKPFPFTNDHPPFRVPGWGELLGAEEEIPAAEMVRHLLVTGESGSGKTISAVIPVMRAALRYPQQELYDAYAAKAGSNAEPRSNLRPAVLVVDPKQELWEVVEAEAAGRKVTTIQYGTPGEVLYFFEGRDLAEMNANDAVDSIVAQSDFFTRDLATTREPIWSIQAASLIKDFVAIDMYLARQGMDKLQELWSKVRSDMEKHSEYSAICPSLYYSRSNYFRPIASLVAYSSSDEASYPMAIYIDACNELKVPGDLSARIVTVMTLAHNTRSSVIWMANGILSDIGSDEFASCVSLNPIEPPERALSVRRMLDDGDVLVYIPTVSASAIADTLGRCIKSRFMEFVFTRANKTRPFAYIVDEAHRFITSGEQDGEQGLLDRCRAYRTMVVLATQSIASMRVRLEAEISGSSALQVMLNNCGTALYFRSSDISTQDSVRARIPECPAPRRQHVVSVRPLTSLSTGSCYALRANGTWGLFQVHIESD
jgi:hypothetical protein